MGEWIGFVAAATVLAAALYWLLVLAEGAYLGPRVVRWLYDRAAGHYDRIKEYDVYLEDTTLGKPLAKAIGGSSDACILDVAAGTGRVLMTLLRQPAFCGYAIGGDLSRRMLEVARGNLAGHAERVALIQLDAGRLPFGEAAFDAVTCCEALEFFPDPMAALAEMVRVLRPGGTLFFTNRVGWEARVLPGRAFSRRELLRRLEQLPLQEVRLQRWEVNYDQIWARRAGIPDRPAMPEGVTTNEDWGDLG